MKKKVTLILFGLLTFLAQAQAKAEENCFNGWYVGVGLGATEETLKHSSFLNVNIPEIPLIVNEVGRGRESSRSFDGKLSVGYSKVFNQKIYTAIEGSLDFHKMKSDVSINSWAIVNNTPVTAFNSDIMIKNSNVFGTLLFKPGIMLSPRTVIFVALGTKVGRFKASATDSFTQFNTPNNFTSTGNGSKTSSRFGLAIGAGMETYITKQMSIGFDYLYVNYGKLPRLNVVSSFNTPTGMLTLLNKTRLDSNSLFFRANWHF